MRSKINKIYFFQKERYFRVKDKNEPKWRKLVFKSKIKQSNKLKKSNNVKCI